MNGEPIFRVSRRTTLVVLAAVFVLAVAACGSPKAASPTTESSMSAASTGASGAGSVQQEFDAYRACLQERGVENGGGFGGRGERPSGAVGGGQVARSPGASGPPVDAVPRSTVDQASLASAQSACAALRPAGGTGANGGFGGSGASGASGGGAPQFGVYLSCLSDNGVASAAGGRAAAGIDRSTPMFAAAHDKCKVLLPDGVDPFAGGARGGPPGALPTTTAAN